MSEIKLEKFLEENCWKWFKSPQPKIAKEKEHRYKMKKYAVYLYTPAAPQGWATKRVNLQSTSILQAQIDVTSTDEYKTLFLKQGNVDVQAVPTHNEPPTLNRTPEQEIAWHKELDRRRLTGEFENHRIGLHNYKLKQY